MDCSRTSASRTPPRTISTVPSARPPSSVAVTSAHVRPRGPAVRSMRPCRRSTGQPAMRTSSASTSPSMARSSPSPLTVPFTAPAAAHRRGRRRGRDRPARGRPRRRGPASGRRRGPASPEIRTFDPATVAVSDSIAMSSDDDSRATPATGPRATVGSRRHSPPLAPRVIVPDPTEPSSATLRTTNVPCVAAAVDHRSARDVQAADDEPAVHGRALLRGRALPHLQHRLIRARRSGTRASRPTGNPGARTRRARGAVRRYVGPFDDEPVDVGAQAAGDHVHAPDAAARPERFLQPPLDLGAQDLLREVAEGEEEQRGDGEGSAPQEDGPSPPGHERWSTGSATLIRINEPDRAV